MKRPRSIRFKLITLSVIVLGIVFIVFGTYIYVAFRQLLVSSLEQILHRRAQQIAVTIVDELPAKGEEYVGSEIQARYAPELNERIIRITDENSAVIYASRNASLLATRPEKTATALQSDRPVYWETEATDRESYRLVAIGHRLSNGHTYVVEVGAPENGIENSLHDLLLTLLVGFPVLIGLSILGGY